MSFKSDAHRKWYFAVGQYEDKSESQNENIKIVFSKEQKERLRREEELILELQNSRSNNS